MKNASENGLTGKKGVFLLEESILKGTANANEQNHFPFMITDASDIIFGTLLVHQIKLNVF